MKKNELEPLNPLVVNFVAFVRGATGAALLVAFIFGIALGLEAGGYTTSVERSGPAMIVFAFLSVAAKNYVGEIPKRFRKVKEGIMADAYRELEVSLASIVADFETDDERDAAKEVASRAVRDRWRTIQQELELPPEIEQKTAAAMRDLFRTEWILGTFGTVIWGFGDLIPWHLAFTN